MKGTNVGIQFFRDHGIVGIIVNEMSKHDQKNKNKFQVVPQINPVGRMISECSLFCLQEKNLPSDFDIANKLM